MNCVYDIDLQFWGITPQYLDKGLDLFNIMMVKDRNGYQKVNVLQGEYDISNIESNV